MKPLGTFEEELVLCYESFAGSKVGDACKNAHHDPAVPLERLEEPAENRIQCFLTDKVRKETPEQVARRLHEFRLWPIDEVPAEVVRSWKACDPAWKAYASARKARAGRDAYDDAWDAYERALAAYDRALEHCRPEIEDTLRRLWPDSTWNGKTIFP